MCTLWYALVIYWHPNMNNKTRASCWNLVIYQCVRIINSSLLHADAITAFTGGFSPQRTSNAELWCSLCCLSGHDAKQRKTQNACMLPIFCCGFMYWNSIPYFVLFLVSSMPLWLLIYGSCLYPWPITKNTTAVMCFTKLICISNVRIFHYDTKYSNCLVFLVFFLFWIHASVLLLLFQSLFLFCFSFLFYFVLLCLRFVLSMHRCCVL